MMSDPMWVTLTLIVPRILGFQLLLPSLAADPDATPRHQREIQPPGRLCNWLLEGLVLRLLRLVRHLTLMRLSFTNCHQDSTRQGSRILRTQLQSHGHFRAGREGEHDSWADSSPGLESTGLRGDDFPVVNPLVCLFPNFWFVVVSW